MTPRVFPFSVGLALACTVLVAPVSSYAQQPAKVYRIGFLGAGSEPAFTDRVGGLRQGLRDLGYVEGQNFVLEFRWAEGQYNRLQAMADELVRLNVDLIVTLGTPGVQAAKRATATIPIVMMAAGDAVASGLIASLARPGGNLTGFTFFLPELNAKRLELLKEAFPRLRRVAVLVNPDNSVMAPALRAMALTAGSLHVALEPFEVRSSGDFESAFAAMARRPVDAVVIIEEPMLIGEAKGLAVLAANHRLPAMGFKEFAKAGGLMAYAVDIPDLSRRAAVFVDKILKGAKPADLPVERATRFELVVNLKTAKALRLTIPKSLLARADEVIE